MWWRRATTPPSVFSLCLARHRVQRAGHKHTSYKGVHTAFAVLSGMGLLEEITPRTYRAALDSKQAGEWLAAMQKEHDGCLVQQVWDVVPRSSLPPGTNVIPVKWVFKIKTDETGKISKFKARITPKGFKQKYGIDFFEVFANTGKYKSLRAMLSLAARRDMELRQLDVPQAFTQAELREVVYMEMPEGFAVPGMVCRLKKSLYGLKQAPRNWYLLVSAFIQDELGFRACVSDPCLFFKQSQSGQLILLFLFVDDMQFAFDAKDEAEFSRYHAALQQRFNITSLGESKFMLGMRIIRHRASRTLTLDQELYISKALEKFGLDQCKPVQTPAVVIGSTAADDREGKLSEPTDVKLYQEKVGTLLYAAISTRPDIAFAVNRLTQHMQAPTVADAHACDRVFRYLAGTKSRALLFGRSEPSTATVSAYADADWGNDRNDRKSVTGWIALIHGDPISWASKKQKVVAQSTCEAELYAEAAAINEAKWISGLLEEIGLQPNEVPLIYGDNQSAQELSKNDIKSERTKHIDIKYHYIHDEVKSGRVRLQWIPTTQQLADVLTKALNGPQHAELSRQLLVEIDC
jgi:Reverse transcriptase (RNA-dependent DNA polymerase)